MRIQKGTFILVVLILVVLYFLIGYKIDRTDHVLLFACFVGLVVSFLIQLRFVKIVKPSWLFISGILFRLIFILSIPRLSDDFYRFYWDGEIQVSGIPAFASTPSELKTEGQKTNLQERVDHFPNGMNSENYYSIYPYTLQPIFYISSFLSKDLYSAVYWMHTILLLFEIISFFLLKKVLSLLDKPKKWVFLYWLNPFVIIEVVGNLHFEGVAITFILLAIYAIYQKREKLFASSVILAFGAKLTPIFILPALLSKWGWKKTVRLSLIIIPTCVLLMLFLIGWNNLPNFWSSVLLYFEKFEFNSGLFTLSKQGLLALTEVDYAEIIRPVSTFIFIGISVYLSFFNKQKSVALKLLWFYTVYLLLGQITHPWYLTLLLPLAILSERIYPFIWAFLAFFSYSAYNLHAVEESLLFLGFESVIVLVLIYLEEFKKINLYQIIQRRLF